MARKSRPSQDRGCLFDKLKYQCKHREMDFKRPCHDVCRKVKVPRKLKKLCCTRSHSKFKNKLQVKAMESRQTGLVGFDQKRRWVQYPGNYPYCAELTMPKYTKAKYKYSYRNKEVYGRGYTLTYCVKFHDLN